MAEQITQQSQQHLNSNNSSIDVKKSFKVPEFPVVCFSPSGITRERSFVRMPNLQNHQNLNKRRSLAFNIQQQQQHQHQHHHHQHQHQQQIRQKPAMEIYRPPNVRVDGPQNKLNVHAQEFTMGREQMQQARTSNNIFTNQGFSMLQHSKSSGNMQQHLQIAAARHHAAQMASLGQSPRTILVSHPLQLGPIGIDISVPTTNQISLVNSSSSGNVLHSAPRVKFAPEPQIQHHLGTPMFQQQQQQQQQQLSQQQLQHHHQTTQNANQMHQIIKPGNLLQRSKSLSSADAIARGIAGLGLAIENEATDVGSFSSDIQLLIDQAREDPNKLNARSLMELANHIMQRAVEGRRYALPTSRFCIKIIAKEKKETFLEALLNTCRQWYQERDKVLGPPQSIKNISRPRFTAFMAFLTEMFSQLKRRQLQLHTKCDGVPPPMVILTLLAKCCEDCVKPPVRSLTEIECLFFVLTCIGKDLECHLPKQLETLLSSVRDAFLNSSASAPGIRRTLLQLIELQASRWQLPGNTVLYYYPSSK